MDADLDLRRRYNRSLPRYTRYPTAPHSGDDVGREAFQQTVQHSNAVAPRLSSRRPVTQIHWGGGTPTLLTPGRRLLRNIATALDAYLHEAAPDEQPAYSESV